MYLLGREKNWEIKRYHKWHIYTITNNSYYVTPLSSLHLGDGMTLPTRRQRRSSFSSTNGNPRKLRRLTRKTFLSSLRHGPLSNLLMASNGRLSGLLISFWPIAHPIFPMM